MRMNGSIMSVQKEVTGEESTQLSGRKERRNDDAGSKRTSAMCSRAMRRMQREKARLRTNISQDSISESDSDSRSPFTDTHIRRERQRENAVL